MELYHTDTVLLFFFVYETTPWAIIAEHQQSTNILKRAWISLLILLRKFKENFISITISTFNQITCPVTSGTGPIS